MTVIFLGIVLLLFIFYGSKIGSPEILILSLWLLIFTINDILKIYELSFYLRFLISTYLVVYCIFSKLSYCSTRPIRSVKYINDVVLMQIKVILLISFIGMFFSIQYIIATVGNPFLDGNITQAIRRHFVELHDSGTTPIYLSVTANFGVLLIFFTYSSTLKASTKFILVFIAFFATLIPMSKGYVLMGLSQIFALSLISNKVSYFKLIILITIGFIALSLSAVFRDSIDIYEYFKIYLFSALPAFDLLLHDKFSFPYPALFRDLLAPVFELFSDQNYRVIEDNFVLVPEYTNVFTLFGPIVSDYGIFFAYIYIIFLGSISGIIFKLAYSGNKYGQFMYGFVVFSIATSIFSDGFSLLSTYIKYAITFYLLQRIPYLTIAKN